MVKIGDIWRLTPRRMGHQNDSDFALVLVLSEVIPDVYRVSVLGTNMEEMNVGDKIAIDYSGPLLWTLQSTIDS